MTFNPHDRNLSVFHHPVLTVLVDDSKSFIDSLAFQMDAARGVITFTDPREALQWIREAYATRFPGFLPVRVTHDDLTFLTERRTVQLDIDRIYRQIHDVNRFLQPGVVVVDYSMPQMDGLEFCQALQDLPCKTILLTGTADESIAVQGFNHGLIDRYVKKHDSNMVERLDQEIEAMQQAYFATLSRTLRELLTRHSFSFLSDPAMTERVRQLTARYGFVEYYLYPNPAGILLLTAQGHATLMVIETRAGLMTQVESAEAYDAPAALIEGLREGRLVPFFWPGNGMYTPACVDWEQYCLPAERCEGREEFFYALFDLPRHLLQEPVVSLQSFLADFSRNPDALTGRKRP
ncbi:MULTISPECIES: response regulator [Cupriavidus]|uniref:Response regulator receiver isolated domain n=2 Tax=Cupriavidus TaxID=106589 RepID=A0A375F492_9BURK|nr:MULTISPECIES: response regulator [Cupriavidus]NUO88657.1 response regulator transcription factor [Cupriavidus sp.]MCO4892116.1 response regulator [Cupriavidus sp. WGtm5]MEC3768122.1 response regulator [Cupriavidus sp. SS-3]NOV25306.1 response regulator transcription factor [Cupriavidus necator]NUT13524.1 response regulator transcription factor [Cupriavidus sp.]